MRASAPTPHAGWLLAVDVAPTALARTRDRCRYLRWVAFARMRVPDEFPRGAFDLVLLSEVGYYLSREDLERLRDRIVAALMPGGYLVLAHWTPRIDDGPLTGDQVHALFLAPGGGLRRIGGGRAPGYRLDVLQRAVA